MLILIFEGEKPKLKIADQTSGEEIQNEIV